MARVLSFFYKLLRNSIDFDNFECNPRGQLVLIFVYFTMFFFTKRLVESCVDCLFELLVIHIRLDKICETGFQGSIIPIQNQSSQKPKFSWCKWIHIVFSFGLDFLNFAIHGKWLDILLIIIDDEISICCLCVTLQNIWSIKLKVNVYHNVSAATKQL